MGNGELFGAGIGSEVGIGFSDSPFPTPGYFGASRTAPSRRIVSPLR